MNGETEFDSAKVPANSVFSLLSLKIVWLHIFRTQKFQPPIPVWWACLFHLPCWVFFLQFLLFSRSLGLSGAFVPKSRRSIQRWQQRWVTDTNRHTGGPRDSQTSRQGQENFSSSSSSCNFFFNTHILWQRGRNSATSVSIHFNRIFLG